MDVSDLVKLKPDTLQVVLQEIGLGKPGEIEDAIEKLKEWIHQQPHFKKRDYHEHFLKTTIIMSGSLERAKKQIEKMCTMRTFCPKIFGVQNVKKEFSYILEHGSFITMPEITDQNQRVFIASVHGKISNSSQLTDFYRYGFCFGEYLKRHDCIGKYHYIFDLRQANMMELLAVSNPLEMKQSFTILTECYGVKIKGIHFVTKSKLIESFFTILKQFLKPKMVQRLHHHSSTDTLVEIMGEKFLPSDLGGTGPSTRELHNKWVEALSSEESTKFFQEMNEALIDESLRSTFELSEEYAGMAGSFRTLTVD
ncbi:unnamed protein product [Leptosia nina]|uniref:CRAL-TRIO domain-containing protein n=1 Tax=Leptosia nina TaxID=320188 RepID=A0AAV1IWH9_9NEOP